MIRKLNLKDKYAIIPEHKQELIIQKKIASYSLKFLEEKYNGDPFINGYVENLCARLKLDLNFFNREPQEETADQNTLKDYQTTYLELLEQQRKLLNEMNQRAEFDEELIRKYLSLIDLEEFKIRATNTSVVLPV